MFKLARKGSVFLSRPRVDRLLAPRGVSEARLRRVEPRLGPEDALCFEVVLLEGRLALRRDFEVEESSPWGDAQGDAWGEDDGLPRSWTSAVD